MRTDMLQIPYSVFCVYQMFSDSPGNPITFEPFQVGLHEIHLYCLALETHYYKNIQECIGEEGILCLLTIAFIFSVPTQKTMHVTSKAIGTLSGYLPPNHMNSGQFIASDLPSLKDFPELHTKVQPGTSIFTALFAILLLLLRFQACTCAGTTEQGFSHCRKEDKKTDEQLSYPPHPTHTHTFTLKGGKLKVKIN